MAGLSFLQGGPAPPFAAPPPDAELVKRINTLASYAQRNGASLWHARQTLQQGRYVSWTD
jgi:hypothetical protein